MQLVMQRFRLYSKVWFRFRINARLVTNPQEDHLLVLYTLKDVALTEGHMRRDLLFAALIAIPLAFFFWSVFVVILGVSKIVSPQLVGLGFTIILMTTFSLVYLQIREAVMVNDLLVGRDFKARSLVALLYKEEQIRKMSANFETILEQAKTWHMPEVIDLTPEPPLRILEDDNAVAG